MLIDKVFHLKISQKIEVNYFGCFMSILVCEFLSIFKIIFLICYQQILTLF